MTTPHPIPAPVARLGALAAACPQRPRPVLAWLRQALLRAAALPALLAILALLMAWSPATLASQDFLDPEDAFRLSVRTIDDHSIELRYDVAPGYYLYREQFRFDLTPGRLGEVLVPRGTIKFDETFQKDVESLRDAVAIRVPVVEATGTLLLKVTSQGCADRGLCYPPAEHQVRIELVGFGAAANVAERLAETQTTSGASGAGAGAGTSLSLNSLIQGAVGQTGGTKAPAARPAEPAAKGETGTGTSDASSAVLASGQWVHIALAFLGAGLLLSFTPCVLPMLPILSSLIAGQGASAQPGGRGAFALSVSYSLGMALVYTALGMAAGWVGEGLAAWLQHPAVLSLFALLLVLLALSMFGLYELQLPERWRHGVAVLSGRMRGGRHLGVFAMGGLSALIVSPCVAAPLAGALLYISQTRDIILGGVALFALAMGMSVPLLLLGASAGRWLPRSGAWMEHVKHAFGVLLVAVALWIIQPVLQAQLVMLLWGSLLLVAATYLRVFESPHAGARGWSRLFRGVGAVLAVLGVLQFIGAASGGSNPLQPLRHLATTSARTASDGGAPQFTKVGSIDELDRILATARQPVMLDFYADWCVSCKEMETFTFSDPRVRQRLDRMLLLKADVTANTPEHRALLRRYRLFGPPGTLFFDAAGQELTQVRVIGFQSADRFLQTLTAAGM